MWLLHAGHADDGHRPFAKIPAGDGRRNPRGSFRQSLPLHRISEHRCGDSSGGRVAVRTQAMKLHFLSAGRIRMRKSVYIRDADRSETFDAPVSSALVRHGQGNLLFDTGCHPSVVEHGEARWGALMKGMTPVMRVEDTLLLSLASRGLRHDDIDVVVNSHFHPDHCGCNQFFKNATIIAHAKEIDAADAPDSETAGYLRADWDHGQPMEAVIGEKDVFGDGRVVLMPLRGH